MPRVIIGAPLFNHEKDLPEALESILSQTYRDFALVLVDDGSSDRTPEIAREYEALDPRVRYIRNPARLGMVDNTRRSFEVARELHPEAEYFSFASDHDLWHPRWLQQLVEALDAHPEVVLAYPLNRRIGASGEVLARKPWAFDTFGVHGGWARLRLNMLRMSAGNMLYGLYRVGDLAAVGVYRRVLVPDRLLLTELAIRGQFKQVPQVLWFRRWYGRIFSLGRQRANFFPGRRPLYMYAPWWISHGVCLFWNYAVQGVGEPRVSKRAGAALALRYIVFSGAFHLWQSLRAVRIALLERAELLRPYERRVRMISREVQRRGIVDWTSAHLKPYVGAKARRRARAQLRKRVQQGGAAALRGPAKRALKAFRALPLVRSRLVPSLLKQELDQVPAAPIVAELEQQLARLRKSKGPIIIGPWISEVGFELLYWIPFLNWAVAEYGLDQRRLIVVSRGGARPWYEHLTSEYLDVLQVCPLDEYRRLNADRWADGGNQKQFDVTAMDRDILARVQKTLGLADAQVLHPMLMYRLLRYYWFEKAAATLLTRHTAYRPLAPLAGEAPAELPDDYVAVRFYFRPSFPDTPENRRFAADMIRSISRELPVVLLNTGISLDEHEDLQVTGSHGVIRVDHLMTPGNNLEVQTRIIARARAFVGTYGGLAYVAPFYGVPVIGFYSEESELIPAHLDVGWRLGRLVGTSAFAMDTRSVPLLGTLFDLTGAGPAARETAGSSALAR